MHTRLKHFSLPKDNYGGWKVVYVIGDLFLDSDYKFEGNKMLVKCEDSYIHLLKKLVLSIKYLYEVHNIKEGVIRAGDDLVFNEENLLSFISMENKPDYFGRCGIDPQTPNVISSVMDMFMVNYYLTHQDDFSNPQHNLKGVNINAYVRRANVTRVAAGVVYFISNASCKILVDHMENINFNIFHLDVDTQSYPYTIEDCAVGFILFKGGVELTHSPYMYTDLYLPGQPGIKNFIAGHTNLYK
jgi:hypothetical protein